MCPNNHLKTDLNTSVHSKNIFRYDINIFFKQNLYLHSKLSLLHECKLNMRLVMPLAFINWSLNTVLKGTSSSILWFPQRLNFFLTTDFPSNISNSVFDRIFGLPIFNFCTINVITLPNSFFPTTLDKLIIKQIFLWLHKISFRVWYQNRFYCLYMYHKYWSEAIHQRRDPNYNPLLYYNWQWW